MTENERRAIELLMNQDEVTYKSANWSFFFLMNALLPNSIYKSVPHSESDKIDNIKKGVA